MVSSLVILNLRPFYVRNLGRRSNPAKAIQLRTKVPTMGKNNIVHQLHLSDYPQDPFSTTTMGGFS